MKLVVTGASGLVGSAVVRHAAALGIEPIAIVGRWSGGVPGAIQVHPVDLASGDAALERLLAKLRPDVLINAAAVAEPAACDAAPELSEALNVRLPGRLAEFATPTGIRVIHLSTEQVFDGESAPYAPSAPPRPINRYGRDKLEGERAVLRHGGNHAIVRAPLLLGNSLTGRRSLHEKLFELWSDQRPARLYADEIRQVCTADNLALALLELAARRELRGVHHWAGAEPLSRLELGRRVARRFNIPGSLIVPVHRSETPDISRQRPRDLSLILDPLDRILKTRPQSVEAALAELKLPGFVRASSSR